MGREENLFLQSASEYFTGFVLWQNGSFRYNNYYSGISLHGTDTVICVMSPHSASEKEFCSHVYVYTFGKTVCSCTIVVYRYMEQFHRDVEE